ncbi:c-type cytochrome [Calditerrivibrio sp.]
MKKIASFFMVLSFVSTLYAIDGKELFQSKCTSCHGTSGEKKALGT